ncbi:MAG: hypothetical protein QXF25_01975 [Candidatus Pacearchaeota archaeon]
MLMRIDKILDEIAKATTTNDLIKWTDLLGALYNELRFILSEDEKNFKYFEEMFFRLQELKKEYIVKKQPIELYGKLFYLNMVFDTALRKEMQERSMIYKKEKDPRKAVLG